MRLRVRVVPNARKTECVGLLGDSVKIKVCAPPLDGKANEELVLFLSRKLNLPKKSVEVVSGERSRDKLVELKIDIKSEEILEILSAP